MNYFNLNYTKDGSQICSVIELEQILLQSLQTLQKKINQEPNNKIELAPWESDFLMKHYQVDMTVSEALEKINDIPHEVQTYLKNI